MPKAITPLVEAFPNDDKEYVVWCFGCLKKNTSDKSITPLVEVALIEIRPTGKLASHSKSYYIPVTELDIVRIWSIWKNKRKLEKSWKELTTAPFQIDASKDSSEPLTFFSKRPDSSEYYIPNEIYNFNSLDQRISGGGNSYRTRQMRHYFAQAKLTKLITYRGVEVLIPSLELFSSMYTPFEKEIRRKLLTKNYKDVLADYLNLDECFIKNDEYHISLKSYKDESNIYFLAYLALNKTTRRKVSKLWASIMSGEGSYFPSIEPYHSDQFLLRGEGLWLKENKTFLVLRVTTFSLPHQIKINVTYPATIKKIKKRSSVKRKKVNKKQVTLFKDLPLSSDFDPGLLHSTVYLNSEVDVISAREPVIQKVQSKGSQEYSSGKTDVQSIDIDQPINMSSGDTSYSQDNEHTARIRTSENLNQKNMIEVVYETLIKLRDSNNLEFTEFMDKTRIKKIDSFNESGEIFSKEGYGQFPERILSMKKLGAWSTIKVNRKPQSIRKFLLVKITLDNNKSAYIIEIQRSHTEMFSGMFFQIKDSLITKENIEELLIAIACTKGRLTYHTDKDEKTVVEIRELSFIKKYLTYNHFGIREETTNTDRMISLIESALSEKVFQTTS